MRWWEHPAISASLWCLLGPGLQTSSCSQLSSESVFGLPVVSFSSNPQSLLKMDKSTSLSLPLCLLFARAAVSLVLMTTSVLQPCIHLGPSPLPSFINAAIAYHKSISSDSTQESLWCLAGLCPSPLPSFSLWNRTEVVKQTKAHLSSAPALAGQKE